jgi:hypothetical protein
MISISNAVIARYEAHLTKRGIVAVHHAEYKKWLRYYLDFCDKHPVQGAESVCIRLFCEKLREKKQSEQQLQQAAFAVSLYFGMQRQEGQAKYHHASIPEEEVPGKIPAAAHDDSPEQGLVPGGPAGPHPQQTTVKWGSSHYCEAGYQVTSDSPEWDEVLAKLAAEITVRHYSRKTLKT